MFEILARAITVGDYDDRPGELCGAQRLIMLTDPDVMNGELSQDQQARLFLLWFERQRQEVAKRT